MIQVQTVHILQAQMYDFKSVKRAISSQKERQSFYCRQLSSNGKSLEVISEIEQILACSWSPHMGIHSTP